MSTCIGAPFPHLNCPHGTRCDYGRPYPSRPQHDPTALGCVTRREYGNGAPTVAMGAVCPACSTASQPSRGVTE